MRSTRMYRQFRRESGMASFEKGCRLVARADGRRVKAWRVAGTEEAERIEAYRDEFHRLQDRRREDKEGRQRVDRDALARRLRGRRTVGEIAIDLVKLMAAHSRLTLNGPTQAHTEFMESCFYLFQRRWITIDGIAEAAEIDRAAIVPWINMMRMFIRRDKERSNR